MNLPPARGKVRRRGRMCGWVAEARMRASRRGSWGAVHWEGIVSFRATKLDVSGSRAL